MDDFLATVRERYKRCIDAESENRRRALEALRFRNLEQWDDKVKNDRETDPEGARPCLVLDKLNQHVNQVVNDQRLNRPQIKVRPVDSGADIETAKIYDGIIRHIQDQSRADIAYDTAFEHAVDGGFGYWRIVAEYCDEMSFDQDLRIKRVRNRFAVHLDPDRQEPDGSDSKFGFVLDKVQTEDFKRAHPDADASGWAGDEFQDWGSDEWVLVAEHFWIEPEEVTICLLADADGTVVRKDEYDEGKVPDVFETDPMGLPTLVKKAIQKKRQTTINRVLWRKLTGKEILEPTGKEDSERGIVKAKDGDVAKLWPSKWIPIVEVIGNELDIEGKVYRAGLIYGAMDSQRAHNYAGSAFIENVGMAPRAPWLAAEGQIEGHENDWKTANRRNLSVLTYKAATDEATGALLPPPTRLPPPGIPAGWLAVLQNTEHDLQASMGRYAASVGEPSNEKSGIAIRNRSHESDVGTFHFQDNEARSINHTGRILIDAIPKYYDTKRIVRIIGEDGEPDHVTIDPDLKDEQTGKPLPYAEKKKDDGSIERIYNLTAGKYDVTVSVGPSFTTRRQEAAEFLTNAVQSAQDPVLASALIYLALKNQDWAGSDEAVNVLKRLLPQNIIEDADAGVIQTPEGPVPVDQAASVIAKLSEQLKAIMQDAEMTKEKNRTLDLQIRGKELLQKDDEIKLKSRELDIKERDSKFARAQEATAAKQQGAEAVLSLPIQ